MGLLRIWLAFAALALPGSLAASAQDRPYHIPGAVERSLPAASGEVYRIFVHVPDSPPPPAGFPVLYVLDGEDNFPIAVAIARRLARAAPRSSVEPGIVVGIDAGDLRRRAFDYTPDFGRPAIREGQPGYGLPTGGADAFLDFLSGRLQPALARDFPIDTDRTTIAGHSFGGLLAIHALMARRRQFCTHVAVSPSLWLADKAIFERAEKERHAYSGRLFIAVGESEDHETATRFAERLRDKGAMASTRILAGETHGTTMPAALSQAVTAAFGSHGCAPKTDD